MHVMQAMPSMRVSALGAIQAPMMMIANPIPKPANGTSLLRRWVLKSY